MSVRMGRFGPFVQIGTKDDEEKPRFAGLRPGQKMDTIALAEALELFKLPRTLGVTAGGESIVANVGRFGPYLKYGDKYVSLKQDDPYTITLERALECIRAKQEADANRIIRRLRPRRHPGAQRPLRSLHQQRREECARAEGSRPEDADTGGVPRAAGGRPNATSARSLWPQSRGGAAGGTHRPGAYRQRRRGHSPRRNRWRRRRGQWQGCSSQPPQGQQRHQRQRCQPGSCGRQAACRPGRRPRAQRRACQAPLGAEATWARSYRTAGDDGTAGLGTARPQSRPGQGGCTRQAQAGGAEENRRHLVESGALAPVAAPRAAQQVQV